MMRYLSISSEGNGVVGATCHLCHSLAQEVSWHEGRGQPMVGGAVAQLAVTIVAPRINLSIYIAVGNF